MSELVLFWLLILFALHSLVPRIIFPFMNRKRIDWFSPQYLFPFAYALVYGAGILKLTDWEEDIPLSQYNVHFLALAAYFVGCFCAKIFYKPRGQYIRKITLESEKRLIFIAMAITVFFAIFVFAKGGIPLFSKDVENARTQLVVVVGGWSYYMYRSIAVIIMIYFSYVASNSVRAPSKEFLRFKILLVFSMVLAMMSGYRGQVLTIFLVIIVAWNYLVNRIDPARLALWGMLAVGAFALAGAMRAAGSVEGLSGSLDKLYVEIQNPANAVRRLEDVFPHKYPFFGAAFLMSAFDALMPGTQLAYGLMLKDLLKMDFQGGGFTPSLIGGFYLVGGYGVAVMGLFVYGLVLGGLYKNMRYTKNGYVAMLYSYSLVYAINTIRGGFFQELISLWFVMVIVIFWKITYKKDKNRSLPNAVWVRENE